jgi:triosephosphate isomerase
LTQKMVIIANWKMNKTIGEATDYAHHLKGLLSGINGVEVILAAPFTALWPLAEALQGSRVGLAAQNIHWEDSGPYTGEVSSLQVRDAGGRYVLIGHSERRQHFGEGYDQVNRKVHAAYRHQLYPVICLGETLGEREAHRTLDVVGEQMNKGLMGAQPDWFENLLIAYEPVWAIGSGETVTPQEASQVHQFIQQRVRDLFGPAIAAKVRILYGGSVTSRNALPFLDQPGVNGLLVGGASLEFKEFSKIVKCAAQRRN